MSAVWLRLVAGITALAAGIVAVVVVVLLIRTTLG
jgi:hypothetical protein